MFDIGTKGHRHKGTEGKRGLITNLHEMFLDTDLHGIDADFQIRAKEQREEGKDWVLEWANEIGGGVLSLSLGRIT